MNHGDSRKSITQKMKDKIVSFGYNVAGKHESDPLLKKKMRQHERIKDKAYDFRQEHLDELEKRRNKLSDTLSGDAPAQNISDAHKAYTDRFARYRRSKARTEDAEERSGNTINKLYTNQLKQKKWGRRGLMTGGAILTAAMLRRLLKGKKKEAGLSKESSFKDKAKRFGYAIAGKSDPGRENRKAKVDKILNRGDEILQSHKKETQDAYDSLHKAIRERQSKDVVDNLRKAYMDSSRKTRGVAGNTGSKQWSAIETFRKADKSFTRQKKWGRRGLAAVGTLAAAALLRKIIKARRKKKADNSGEDKTAGFVRDFGKALIGRTDAESKAHRVNAKLDRHKAVVAKRMIDKYEGRHNIDPDDFKDDLTSNVITDIKRRNKAVLHARKSLPGRLAASAVHGTALGLTIRGVRHLLKKRKARKLREKEQEDTGQDKGASWKKIKKGFKRGFKDSRTEGQIVGLLTGHRPHKIEATDTPQYLRDKSFRTKNEDDMSNVQSRISSDSDYANDPKTKAILAQLKRRKVFLDEGKHQEALGESIGYRAKRALPYVGLVGAAGAYKLIDKYLQHRRYKKERKAYLEAEAKKNKGGEKSAGFGKDYLDALRFRDPKSIKTGIRIKNKAILRKFCPAKHEARLLSKIDAVNKRKPDNLESLKHKNNTLRILKGQRKSQVNTRELRKEKGLRGIARGNRAQNLARGTQGVALAVGTSYLVRRIAKLLNNRESKGGEKTAGLKKHIDRFKRGFKSGIKGEGGYSHSSYAASVFPHKPFRSDTFRNIVKNEPSSGKDDLIKEIYTRKRWQLPYNRDDGTPASKDERINAREDKLKQNKARFKTLDDRDKIKNKPNALRAGYQTGASLRGYGPAAGIGAAALLLIRAAIKRRKRKIKEEAAAKRAERKARKDAENNSGQDKKASTPLTLLDMMSQYYEPAEAGAISIQLLKKYLR